MNLCTGLRWSSARASRRAIDSPTLYLIPAPHSAAGIFGERSGEAHLLGDLVGSLLAHPEELGDLDEPHPRWRHHVLG
jgi:hypothetical protein